MNEDFSLEDALIILRRRFWYFIIPVLVIAPLGVAYVMSLPAVYRAQGTILVESQQIPSNLVQSTINAYAQERIQTIRQRVMTVNQAIKVADTYGIFPEGSRLSESDRVAKMRERLNVSLITVERRGSSGDGTIAFTVSYRDEDPQKAYLVANEFMTLFLAEDVRSRTAGASSTTDFFEREAEKLLADVTDLERRISDFKVENADALPEQLQTHLGMLERAGRQLEGIQRTNEQLEEEKQFLASQLMTGSQSNNGLAAQLAALESRLASLRATYYDGYPEVQATRDEIAAIKRRMAPSAELQRLRTAMVDAESELSELERADEADAAAITAAELRMDEARQALSDQISVESRSGVSDPSNLQTEGRIAIIDNRIRMNARRETSLREQIANLEERIVRTPSVERALIALTRDYQNLEREYQEIRAKQQDAQLAENLEENQQAEKFSILEPARRPSQPSSPNRPRLVVMALLLAGAAGGGLAVLAELLFATVRGRNHLSAIVGDHPIAIVPYIPGDEKENALTRLFRRSATGRDNDPDDMQVAA